MTESNDYIFFLLVEKLGFGDEYLDHLELWKLLLKREFYYMLPMDRNRAIDGIDLRTEFLERYNVRANSDLLDRDGTCSVLEMMVALALRIEYEIIGEIGEERPFRWLNLMINNLDLEKFRDDRLYSGWKIDANYILDRWMKKDYSVRGDGSLFPLDRSLKNQKKMEIWSQMCEYLNENFF